MREPQIRTIYNNYDLWDQYSEFAKETLSEYEEEPSEDSIWNVINDEDSTNWECEKERLEKFLMTEAYGFYVAQAEDGTELLRQEQFSQTLWICIERQ